MRCSVYACRCVLLCRCSCLGASSRSCDWHLRRACADRKHDEHRQASKDRIGARAPPSPRPCGESASTRCDAFVYVASCAEPATHPYLAVASLCPCRPWVASPPWASASVLQVASTLSSGRSCMQCCSRSVPEHRRCKLSECRPMSAHIDPNPLGMAQIWPALGRIGAERGRTRSNSCRLGIYEVWPEIGQFRPTSAQNRPSLPQRRPDLADFYRIWPELDQYRPTLARFRPNLARTRPTLGRFRATLARVLSNFARFG